MLICNDSVHDQYHKNVMYMLIVMRFIAYPICSSGLVISSYFCKCQILDLFDNFNVPNIMLLVICLDLYVLLHSLSLGMKTKMKIFGYRESFLRFYRVNENENGYRKYGNGNSIFIRN